MNPFTALLDTGFDRLITHRLLGVVYAIALGLHTLAGVVVAVALIASGGTGLLLGALLVPALTALGALVLRVMFEAAVVFFRGAEDLRALREARLCRA